MIWESWPYRVELLRISLRMQVRSRWRGVVSRDCTQTDKDFFFSAYIVRKLSEAMKLDDRVMGLEIPVTQYEYTGPDMEPISWFSIDRSFDFEKGEPTSLTIKRISDLIIHSYLMMRCSDTTGRLAGVMFTSDRTRDQRLFEVGIRQYINMLEIVIWSIPDIWWGRRVENGRIERTIRCTSPSTRPNAEIALRWLLEWLRVLIWG